LTPRYEHHGRLPAKSATLAFLVLPDGGEHTARDVGDWIMRSTRSTIVAWLSEVFFIDSSSGFSGVYYSSSRTLAAPGHGGSMRVGPIRVCEVRAEADMVVLKARRV
jgi:hypothetical protein